MKEIFNRRSIRSFEEKPIEREKVEKLLRAAMQAPSAANQQPWEFIVVEDKDKLNELSKMTPYSKPVEGSAVTLVLLTDSRTFRIPAAWHQDMGAAAQNILLEAVHLGLGGVWLGVSTLDAAAQYVSELFMLPDYIQPFALIALGYPKGAENVFVDRYNEEKVHYETWEGK